MRFIARTIIRTTPERLFAFHELPDAVDRLMPPWERAREDEQLRGPFRRWHHNHIIEPHADGAVLIDDVDFEPPFALISGWIVKRRLRKLFDYRHRVTREWCERADGAKIPS